jgi:hypothetical protein
MIHQYWKNTLLLLIVFSFSCGLRRNSDTRRDSASVYLIDKVQGNDTLFLSYYTTGCFNDEKLLYSFVRKNGVLKLSQVVSEDSVVESFGMELNDSAVSCLRLLEEKGKAVYTKPICTSQYYWKMILNEDSLSFEVLDCSPFPWYNNFVNQVSKHAEE